MKNNSLLLGTLGLSVALHGLALIGAPGGLPRAAAPVTEVQAASTLKMVKTGARPRQAAPVKQPEKQVVEKLVEPKPETIPAEETVNYEEAWDDGVPQQGDTSEAEGSDDGLNDDSAQDNGTITEREYEALLAYIKDFIDKNLVYPPMARRRNIEGVVGVYFEIERTGEFVSVMAGNSSGSSILDNAALSLVKKITPPQNLTLNRTLALNVNITYELTK